MIEFGSVVTDHGKYLQVYYLQIFKEIHMYLQKYVVASPGHGHSGVGPEQAADHLVHHPAGDCR